jgi:MFS family permease
VISLWLGLIVQSSSFSFSTTVEIGLAHRRCGPSILPSRPFFLPHVSPIRTKRQNHYPTLLFATQDDDNSATDLFGFPADVARPLVVLLIAQFILFIGVGAVIPTIPLYGKAIGLSSAANGLVISAPAMAMLLGANPGGKFADVMRKPAMMYGMALICVSDIGTAMSQGVVSLVCCRLGLGAGRCLSEAGERGMLADLAGRAPELRGRSLAAQQAVLALGIAVGAPLGGVVVEQYGPRASFLCVSAAAIIALGIYSFLPETIQNSEVTQEQQGKDETVDFNSNKANEDSSSSDGDWGKLLRENSWRGLAICQCGASFGFAAKISSIPIIAAATLPGGAVGAGALVSAAGLSGLVGAPLGGWLTDRAGARLTAVASGFISATGLLLIPAALSSPFSNVFELPFYLGDSSEVSAQALGFTALVILWSIGASAQGPALTALAQELAPTGAEATAMALPRATGDGTYIVAPFLLGLIADSSLTVPGEECAAAGAATLLGILALALLGDREESH